MNFVRTLGWMTRKELLRFAADPIGALFTLAVPVVLAVLMSSLFAPSGVMEALPLVIAVEQSGPRVERLITSLSEDPSLRLERTTANQARQRVLDGQAAAAVILPAATENVLQPLSMFAGNAVPVEVLFDPSRSTEVDILVGLITREAMTQMSEELGTEQGRARMFQQLGLLTATSPLLEADDKLRWGEFARAGAALGGADASNSTGVPLDLKRVGLEVFNPRAKWNPHAHYFAGMLTMFLLFLAATSALNLISEREEGALTRVMLSGANPLAVLLGGALGTSVIALAASMLVYLAGVSLFGIEIGNAVGLVAMLISISALVGAFSLFLSAVGQTARQISAIAPFLILVMGFIGGSALPSFIMPEWVQGLAIFLPTTWANEGLAAATWRGGSTSECVTWAAGVWGFAGGFAGVGATLFRWT